jgi:Tol biopolymer transport system component
MSVGCVAPALKRNDAPPPAWRLLAHLCAMLAGPMREDRLDSWKEIAAFLGRGIRTVQRWEREEGLPVHRLAHAKRGSIYAKRDELSAWWESRRLTLTSSAPVNTAPAAPRLDRVTRTSGMTSWPALSFDARLLAYVSDAGQDGATPQIWIQQVGGTALQLTNGAHTYAHPSFSPDATRIVFTITDESGPNLYEMPALGGEPRLIQRGASRGVMSPDGRWLASVPRDEAGVRIAARGGAGFRTLAPHLLDIACVAWLPDSRSVIVHARAGPELEADWWILPLGGEAPANTGVVRRFRDAGLFTIPTGVACWNDSLVISGAGPQGICLYRQRLAAATFQAVGAPQRLTEGSESAWLPAAAAGRVAFISNRPDANLWSVAVDPASGVAQGPLRRLTRGTGIVGYLSLTADARRLAYVTVRRGQGEVFLRDLGANTETVVGEGPPGPKWYPAISPSGSQLAFGTLKTEGDRALRPIFVMSLSDGTWRLLGEDCGGRPREWVDERRLVIQRFARLHSVAVVDTDTGDQLELIRSDQRSVANPRLSPDRRSIAFDAAGPGETPAVFVAPFDGRAIAESDWVIVEGAASHPFWSAHGRVLYYTPIGVNPLIRNTVRGRRLNDGLPDGEPMDVYSSSEMMLPAYLPGTAPIATRDQIILALSDFRGDVWIIELAD